MGSTNLDIPGNSLAVIEHDGMLHGLRAFCSVPDVNDIHAETVSADTAV